jgi:pyrroloquinoline quinone biosynthesis protein B
VHWHVIPVAGECRTAVFGIEGQPTLEFTAVATDGPAPRHIARAAQPVVGETIALAVRDTVSGQRLFCANSLVGAGSMAVEWMREADCVLLGDEADGGAPRHSLDTANDIWAQLDGVRARRKLLMIHPDPAAGCRPAPEVLARWGCEVVGDRMEIEL